jgi:chemotaxis protein methyltransferase CheR
VRIIVSITKNEFTKLAEYIKVNYGIYLKEEKMTLVNGRLHNILLNGGFETFTDYYDYLIADKSGQAAIQLINKITTNHTFFMREADHFYFYRDVILPYLATTVMEKDLRIWCAASSTGEESYTLAMIQDDFFGTAKSLWDAKVLATDISENVLDIAKKGIYENDHIASLPKHWILNHFRNYNANSSIISDKLKNEVIFRKFNLMERVFPFKRKFHVIFCRNVMIYFDNDTKTSLVNKFYEQME